MIFILINTFFFEKQDFTHLRLSRSLKELFGAKQKSYLKQFRELQHASRDVIMN